MKVYKKTPVLFAILVLIAYVAFFVMWNIELYLASLYVIFVTASIGWVGAVLTIKEIIRTKKRYIVVNVICFIVTIGAGLIPLILFKLVDIYGF